MFPGGHPSKYYPGPTMLNFGDRTRTGVFIVVWPLAMLTLAISNVVIEKVCGCQNWNVIEDCDIYSGRKWADRSNPW